MTLRGIQQTVAGSFAGTAVSRGAGGGLASTTTEARTVTHFHAARLDDLGDVVLAVSREFAADTGAAIGLELRAFAAGAAGRGSLAAAEMDELLAAPGAFAFARLQLAAPEDPADERRAAVLVRCAVTDAAATGTAARTLAEWMRTTWETELTFGGWPAVRGTLESFATAPGGTPAAWATEWLEATEHLLVDEGAGFLKVLSTAWLDA